jgi:hypothetical protein
LKFSKQTCESAFLSLDTAYHHISGLQNHKVTEWESLLEEMVPSNTPKVIGGEPIQSPENNHYLSDE